MQKIVGWVQSAALGLGAPGLFLAAVGDSSFISLPEVVDILLVWMITQHKSRALVYATSATVGSVFGSLALYWVGRKGDEFVMRRFSAHRVERAFAAFRRFGLMAVLIPSLLPPPTPLKVFVLLAGAAGISTGRFVAAMLIGRGIRYYGEAWLAYRYGDAALAFMHAHGSTIAVGLVIVLATAVFGYILWQKSQRARQR
jgi:membrane protein YqaA with SNARE-associated domain